MCNPFLPISTKPRGVPLPRSGYTFDSPRQPHGVPLPHRGYTFDSAGLASVTQPTLGNDASEEATPWGLYFFSSHIITTCGEQMESRTQIDFKKYNADGIGSPPRPYLG